jgi:eukaryotic-like serine/threonine-protein kinase
MLQDQMILPVGATIQHPGGGRYVIEGLLGTGGFGAVYLVRDHHVKHRLFALKELIDPNRRDRERFIFEAEVLMRLSHRTLPHVYQVFEHTKLKRVYMLMDYIQGRDLRVLLEERPERHFSLPLALAIITPIVDALNYLHSQNPPIIHRDIKPANIIMQTKDGEAMLVDFGLAKEYVVDSTTAIIRHGSPGYAAPEQYGSGTNPRTDIYGLGATFYTLLTGTVPVDAITRVTESKRIDPLVPAHLVTTDVPWAVAMTIERAMSISSDERFSTVEEFWQELTSQASKQQVHEPRPSSIAAPQSLTVPGQELERIKIAPPSLQRQSRAPQSRKRSVLLPIFLALLFTVAIGIGLLPIILRHSSSPTILLKATPQLTMTSAASHPPSTPIPGIPVYPSIAVSYAGTVADLLSNQKTSMFLTHVQQNGGSISGYFQGLGLAGPFKGTVTSTGHVQFTMTVRAGGATLSFDGDIKIGGDMTGNFEALDQHGQRTGEAGIWNVASMN